MMRDVVVPGTYSRQEAEADITYGVAEHKGGDSRGVTLKSDSDHVQHQPDVFRMIVRSIGRRGLGIDYRAGLPCARSCAAGPLHSLFQRPHYGHVLVQTYAVR